MHNLSAIFAKYLKICTHFGKYQTNEKRNEPRRGVVSRLSNLDVKAQSLEAESIDIDSENYLFDKLSEYSSELPHLISRRQFNDRHKQTAGFCNLIRAKIAGHIDGDEEFFCIDSNPIVVCHKARSRRCRMGRANNKKATSLGYCTSQGTYYFGYKLGAV